MNYKKLILLIAVFFGVAFYLRPLRSAQTKPSSAINYKNLQNVITKIWDELTGNIAQKYGVAVSDLEFKLQEMGVVPFNKEQSGELYNVVDSTLNDVLNKTDFSAVLARSENENLVKLIRTTMLTTFFGYYANNDLYWCGCISIPERLTYALRVVYDTRARFPNASQPIVYTAFAAGKLFQDLVILKALSANGYTNITANFIDIGYPDPIFTARIANAVGETDVSEAIAKYTGALMGLHGVFGDNFDQNIIKWEQEYKKLYPTLKKVEAQEAQSYDRVLKLLKSELPATTQITLYRNMSEYLNRAKRYPSEYASNIMSLVDPDLGLFQISPYPSESNLVGLSITGVMKEYEPHVLVAMPYSKPIQVYAQSTAYKEAPVKSLVQAIQKIAGQTKAIIKFTPQFRSRLVDRFSTYNPSALKKQLPAYVSILNDAKKDSSVDSATIDNILDETLGIAQEYKNAIQKLATQGNKSAQMLQKNMSSLKSMQQSSVSREDKCVLGINALTAIISIADLLKQDYTFKWYSDAHLAFQELVAAAATDQTLIYVYAAKDMDNPPQLETFSKNQYLNRDVFKEFTGKMLLTEGNVDDDEDAGDYDDTPQAVDPAKLYIRIPMKKQREMKDVEGQLRILLNAQ